MNNFLIELENDVISLCLANTLFRSEIEKHILMNQYVHCTHHIELTGKGFYDNIIVCKDCKKVNNKDFTLCDIYINLIDISVELGIENFFKDGYIDLIEFYTYEKNGMEKYQIMIFTKLKKKIDYPCLST